MYVVSLFSLRLSTTTYLIFTGKRDTIQNTSVTKTITLVHFGENTELTLRGKQTAKARSTVNHTTNQTENVKDASLIKLEM